MRTGHVSAPKSLYAIVEALIDHNEKMAACTFYQNALRGIRVNDQIKMTRNHLMMRNFSTMKKLNSCLMSVFQKTSIRFCKRFLTAMHSGKMYIRHHYHGQLGAKRSTQ